jgi:hypothetical protein
MVGAAVLGSGDEESLAGHDGLRKVLSGAFTLRRTREGTLWVAF